MWDRVPAASNAGAQYWTGGASATSARVRARASRSLARGRTGRRGAAPVRRQGCQRPRGRSDGRGEVARAPMLGLTMDYPLTLAAIARRAESLFGDRPVVSRRADGTLHRTTYAAVPPPRPPARRRAPRPRRRPRRPRRHALLEPRPPPRGLLRRPAAGRACSTRSTSGSTPTSWPTSPATPRTGWCWWTSRCCRCWRRFRDARRLPARHRGRPTAAALPPGMLDYEALLAARPRRGRRPPRARRARRGGDVLHLGHHRPLEGRGLLAPRAGAALDGHRDGRQLRASARRTSCSPSSRCSTPTPGGFPFTAALTGAGAGLPRPAPRPGGAARALPRGAGHLQRRRPHRLARRARGARRLPRRVRPLARSARS